MERAQKADDCPVRFLAWLLLSDVGVSRLFKTGTRSQHVRLAPVSVPEEVAARSSYVLMEHGQDFTFHETLQARHGGSRVYS